MTDTADESLIQTYIAAHDAALFSEGRIGTPSDMQERRRISIEAHAAATLALLRDMVAAGQVAA